MSQMNSKLGRSIRAQRALRGWRQADLALASGVSRETISRLERGVSTPLNSTARVVAGAFGLALEQLFPPPKGDSERGGGR